MSATSRDPHAAHGHRAHQRAHQRAGFQLILGSASASRAGILERAGIPFTTVVSGVDETQLEAALDDPTPAQLAHQLAEAKAADVAAQLADGLPRHLDPLLPVVIIGSDSVFELDGTAYGKPGTPEQATARWQVQRGRTGTLHTGHALVEVRGGKPQRIASAVVGAEVTFADADDADIARYVATGEPLDCAGGFTLEGFGATLIDSVHGDPNAVLGLSVNVVRKLLARWDYSLTQLWDEPN